MLRGLRESCSQTTPFVFPFISGCTSNTPVCLHFPDSRFSDYGKVELVFSEGPEKIPGRFLTYLLSLFFLCFCICAILCSVPPPLSPGEKGCGMLQRGNVVWSVCWQRSKDTQHVLLHSSAGVKLCCMGPYVCMYLLVWLLNTSPKYNNFLCYSENVERLCKWLVSLAVNWIYAFLFDRMWYFQSLLSPNNNVKTCMICTVCTVQKVKPYNLSCC